MQSLEITYLFNSGFVVKCGNQLLIFDYYLNPTVALEQMIEEAEHVWVFSSHRHADHYNPVIHQWQDKVHTYFLSEDIRYETGVNQIKAEKLVFLKPYEQVTTDLLKVSSFGSTDEGISFYIEVNGWRIFHAGDLNWWHWKGDTPENLRAAAEGFKTELSKIDHLNLDIAFFPVDSRLEEYRAIGAEAFCRTVYVTNLIAMHTRGEVWIPPSAFPDHEKSVAVWCPDKPGESKTYSK
ncbi:MBL fold metallo-hydrolase [bacterium BFN5]|nr:MBL fold metallo-hydrolase [bacterium BFN5]